MVARDARESLRGGERAVDACKEQRPGEARERALSSRGDSQAARLIPLSGDALNGPEDMARPPHQEKDLLLQFAGGAVLGQAGRGEGPPCPGTTLPPGR